MERNTADLGLAGANEQEQYLVFMLGRELFAMNIQAIKEINEVGRLTRVPRMPDVIRGVVNLRGAVVPVVDLGARFDKPRAQITRRSCIIVIQAGGDEEDVQDIGVMVDGVNAVLEIPAAEIKPPPAFGGRIRTDFISGVGRVNDEFVIILNVDCVLAMEELATLAGVSSGEKLEDRSAHVMAA